MWLYTCGASHVIGALGFNKEGEKTEASYKRRWLMQQLCWRSPGPDSLTWSWLEEAHLETYIKRKYCKYNSYIIYAVINMHILHLLILPQLHTLVIQFLVHIKPWFHTFQLHAYKFYRMMSLNSIKFVLKFLCWFMKLAYHCNVKIYILTDLATHDFVEFAGSMGSLTKRLLLKLLTWKNREYIALIDTFVLDYLSVIHTRLCLVLLIKYSCYGLIYSFMFSLG